MKRPDTITRIIALARALDVDPEFVVEDDGVFSDGNGEYLVLTEDEAHAAAVEDCRESLWAFSLDFLLGYMPAGVDAAYEGLLEMQGKMCESATPVIAALLGDRLDECIEDAIGLDGIGHFLARYDGHELEMGDDLFAYRTD